MPHALDLLARHLKDLPFALAESVRGNDARATRDFEAFREKLANREAFTFVRFSDGEMEILRNRRLLLTTDQRLLNGAVTAATYAQYDVKEFDPERDQLLRQALIGSAEFKAPGYWKGLPTKHNGRLSDRDWMIYLNGGGEEGLTFADLFVNSMYPRFRAEVLPLLQQWGDVAVIGNFRMDVKLVQQNWDLIPIPDNAFTAAQQLLRRVVRSACELPEGALVLSAASSLTNVFGHELFLIRPDITFLDVGTALHPLAGMGPSDRWYHLETTPWRKKSSVRKAWYLTSRGRHLRW